MKNIVWPGDAREIGDKSGLNWRYDWIVIEAGSVCETF